MVKRTITALIILLIAAPMIFLKNDILYSIVVFVVSVGASFELFKIHKNLVNFLASILIISLNLYGYVTTTEYNLFPFILVALAFSSTLMVIRNTDLKNFTLSLFSMLLCTVASFGMIKLYENFNLLIYLFIVVFTNDIFAYYIGSFFGKHKLSPIISPKKSIEGAIGGIVCSTLIGLGYIHFTLGSSYLLFLFIGPIVGFSGIIGDLVASKIKRDYGIKDYSNLLPGHGGFMDRFDSIIFCAMISYILFELSFFTNL